MKKLLVPSLLAVFCSACASTGSGSNSGLPNGYTAALEEDGNSAVISRSDGASMHYLQSKNEEAVSAFEVMAYMGRGCDGEVEGSFSKTTIKNCVMGDETRDISVFTSDGIIKVILSNDKVSRADIDYVAEHYFIKH